MAGTGNEQREETILRKSGRMLSHCPITIFVCGDVMTGRGIDQVLPYPCLPQIYEPYVRDARRYVELAEETNGHIPQPADFSYIWGDALDILQRMTPDVRIINLETSVTTSGDYWKGKGINYRMEPRNIPAITAAGIDVCSLANNHVLDWGYAGLVETIHTLQNAKIGVAGAGMNQLEGQAPAIVQLKGKGRVIVFAFVSESSGIPAEWAAAPDTPGVNLLPDLSAGTVRNIEALVRGVKRSGDLVVASIHWGGTGDTASRGRRRDLPTSSSTRPGWTSSTGIPPIMPRGSKSIAESRSSMAAATSSTTMRGSAAMNSTGGNWG